MKYSSHVKKWLLVPGIFCILTHSLAIAGTSSRSLIADSHVHLQSKTLVDTGIPLLPVVTGEDVLKEMDRLGVSHAAVLSGAYLYKYYDGSDRRQKVEAENDFIASEAAKSGGRLIGLCSFPFSEDWINEELDRCFKIGLKGLKLHLAANEIDLADPAMGKRYRTISEKAAALGMVILVHPQINDEKSWWELMSQSVMGANTIFAHALSRNFPMLSDLGLAGDPKYIENLYLDVSGTIYQYRNAPVSLRQSLVWHLRFIGIDHILFASDFPFFSMEESIAALEKFSQRELGPDGFSDTELEKIKFKNFEKLFLQQQPNIAGHIPAPAPIPHFSVSPISGTWDGNPGSPVSPK